MTGKILLLRRAPVAARALLSQAQNVGWGILLTAPNWSLVRCTNQAFSDSVAADPTLGFVLPPLSTSWARILAKLPAAVQTELNARVNAGAITLHDALSDILGDTALLD